MLRDKWMIYISGVFISLGAMCFASVNATLSPFAVIAVFLLVGLLICNVPLFQGREEMYTFVLCFSVFVFVAGLSQLYGKYFLGSLQTSDDSIRLYHRLSTRSFGDIFVALKKMYGYSFVMIVWKIPFSIYAEMGGVPGVWLALIVNSFLVSVSASITVHCGKLLFGNDRERLTLIGVACVVSGMFWLYSSVLLRDAMVLLINVVVFLGFLKMQMSKNSKLMYAWLGVVVVGILTFFCVREEMIPIQLLLLGVTVFCILLSGSSASIRVFVSIVAVGAVILAVIFANKFGSVWLVLAKRMLDGVATSAQDGSGSLGMHWIMTRFFPVRWALGLMALLISPLPFWRYLVADPDVYHIMKTVHGVNMLVIVPVALSGAVCCVKKIRAGGPNRGVWLFLLMYVVLSLFIVAGTSVEIRHYGVFFPALFILIALPDFKDHAVVGRTRNLVLSWIMIVASVYVGWVVFTCMWVF